MLLILTYLKSEMILVKNSTAILMVMMTTTIILNMLHDAKLVWSFIFFPIALAFFILTLWAYFIPIFSLADFQSGPRHFSINWKQPYSHFLMHWGWFIICCKVCSKLDQESIIVFRALRSDSFLATFLDFNSFLYILLIIPLCLNVNWNDLNFFL